MKLRRLNDERQKQLAILDGDVLQSTAWCSCIGNSTAQIVSISESRTVLMQHFEVACKQDLSSVEYI